VKPHPEAEGLPTGFRFEVPRWAGGSSTPMHNAAMNWRDRIVADPSVLVGKAVIKGTRISVELVMDLLARGYTTDQVLTQYPSIRLQDLHACLGYAAELLRSERMFQLPA
jgi:uncharacterized protein (DUF433 family)